MFLQKLSQNSQAVAANTKHCNSASIGLNPNDLKSVELALIIFTPNSQFSSCGSLNWNRQYPQPVDEAASITILPFLTRQMEKF